MRLYWNSIDDGIDRCLWSMVPLLARYLASQKAGRQCRALSSDTQRTRGVGGEAPRTFHAEGDAHEQATKDKVLLFLNPTHTYNLWPHISWCILYFLLYLQRTWNQHSCVHSTRKCVQAFIKCLILALLLFRLCFFWLLYFLLRFGHNDISYVCMWQLPKFILF